MLDEDVREILHKYKAALTYIGVDFSREDVQEALENAYEGIEAVFQRVIEYWYFLQEQNRPFYANACLLKALQDGWTPHHWTDDYLKNPDFKSPCLVWWEKAAQVWGEQIRNQLVADVSETDGGYEYILFNSGKTLPLQIAQVWGWERVLNYAQQSQTIDEQNNS